MYRRCTNSWKQPSDARWECMAKEFIRIELELALTFVKLAQTRYSMGHIARGDISRNNAREAYRSASKYLGKCHDVSPFEREKFTGLVNQAKKAIGTLPQPTTPS
jgi:hypothetical protein